MNIGRQVNELAKQLDQLNQKMKELQGQAVAAYTPLVEEVCSRQVTQNEVECMLDLLLPYAEDDRILSLFKRVCRSYWDIYPDSITFYIMEYRKEYETGNQA